MPFAMAHLIIADNLSEILAEHIDSLPQFYLGSIAPDAVHNRADYISEWKKDSHLIVSDEKWGMITKTDEWKINVINFLNKNKNSENHDFILGYCSHILADLYNNMTVYLPFKTKYPDEAVKGYGSLYHQESNKIDIELALTHKNKDKFCEYLEKSQSVDLPGMVYAAEIDMQKVNILDLWYKDKNRQDISSNKFMTYENTMDFIKNATDFIAVNFQENL